MYRAKKGFMYFHIFIKEGKEFKKSEQGDYEGVNTEIRLPTIFVENCPDIFEKVSEGNIHHCGEPSLSPCDKPDKEIEKEPKIYVSYTLNKIDIRVEPDCDNKDLIKSKLQAFFNNLINQ